MIKSTRASLVGAVTKFFHRIHSTLKCLFEKLDVMVLVEAKQFSFLCVNSLNKISYIFHVPAHAQNTLSFTVVSFSEFAVTLYIVFSFD